MKRILIILIVLALLPVYFSGCSKTYGTRNTLDYARYNTTAEEVAAQHKEHGKIIYDSTIEQDFQEGKVLVMMYPFASHVSFTKEDFSNIGCKQVEVMYGAKEDGHFLYLRLILEDNTKQAVLDAIKELEKRDDVYCAQPNHILHDVIG